MQVREIRDKEEWENFFAGIEHKSFLQSWQWGEFHKRMGHDIWRLGAVDKEGNVHGAALVAKISARRGTFLLVQHAPALAEQGNSKFQIPNSKKEVLGAFIEELKRIGKREGAGFVRMNPLLEQNRENEELMRQFGLRLSPMHANAYDATWKLDITPDEDTLLKNMRKTTRYLIRNTQKNEDIQVETSSRPEDIDTYHELNKDVARRQQFVPFSKEYIKNEFEALSEDGNALWIWGTYKGELVAAALVVFWSGVGFYHQAASRSEYAKLSIPYLVQWQAIKEAKLRGCTMYDFWGYVHPDEHPSHPWAGPTRFKMGFGGQAYEYIKTQDLPLNWTYWPVSAFETLRKLRRGL